MSGNKREQGAEACGVGLCTETLTNYSDAPGRHDGPEGTLPGGKPNCIGPDRESGMRKREHHYIDIWKLALDGRMELLTHFNNYPALKAPNPAVSAGGWYMAFQMAKVGGRPGSAGAPSSTTSPRPRKRRATSWSCGVAR
jgi:hypothetical protein